MIIVGNFDNRQMKKEKNAPTKVLKWYSSAIIITLSTFSMPQLLLQLL